MDFGYCSDCKEYKFLQKKGRCTSCAKLPALSHDSIAVIQGKLGVGKSVLCNTSVERILESVDDIHIHMINRDKTPPLLTRGDCIFYSLDKKSDLNFLAGFKKLNIQNGVGDLIDLLCKEVTLDNKDKDGIEQRFFHNPIQTVPELVRHCRKNSKYQIFQRIEQEVNSTLSADSKNSSKYFGGRGSQFNFYHAQTERQFVSVISNLVKKIDECSAENHLIVCDHTHWLSRNKSILEFIRYFERENIGFWLSKTNSAMIPDDAQKLTSSLADEHIFIPASDYVSTDATDFGFKSSDTGLFSGMAEYGEYLYTDDRNWVAGIDSKTRTNWNKKTYKLTKEEKKRYNCL